MTVGGTQMPFLIIVTFVRPLQALFPPRCRRPSPTYLLADWSCCATSFSPSSNHRPYSNTKLGAVDSIFDFGAVYTVCFFISYASPLVLLSSLFLTYLLPYLFFSFENRPAPFPGCRTGRQNLTLVLLVYFVHFFWSVNACFCCVIGLVFSIRAKRLAWGETSPKWRPILCRVGRKTTIQSIKSMMFLAAHCEVQLMCPASIKVTR